MATLYVDYVSQPCRACVLFCRVNNLTDVQEKLVSLSKGEHRAPDFLALNPLGKVPFLTEGDFKLPESASILRYLATTRQACPLIDRGSMKPQNASRLRRRFAWVAARERCLAPGTDAKIDAKVTDNWYPADAQRRARVDACMDWHHSTVRRGVTSQVWNRVLAGMAGLPASAAEAKQGVSILAAALKALEGCWLDGSAFVAGHEVSIADLLVVMELEMLRLLAASPEGPSMGEQLAPFPAVRAWMARVPAAVGRSHYEKVNSILDKVMDNAKRKLQSAKL